MCDELPRDRSEEAISLVLGRCADGSFIENTVTGERFMMEMQVGPQEVEDDAIGMKPGSTRPGR